MPDDTKKFRGLHTYYEAPPELGIKFLSKIYPYSGRLPALIFIT